MILRNHKDVYAKTAEKLDMNLGLVHLIGNFTWGDLNNRFSRLENREIYVLKLGTFTFRKKKSLRYVDNLNKIIPHLLRRNLPEESKQRMMEKIEYKKQRINILSDEWQKIYEEKKEFKANLNESSIGDIQK